MPRRTGTRARFSPVVDGTASILQPAEGLVITPNVGDARVVLIVDAVDFDAVNSLRGDLTGSTVWVTDLMTGLQHHITADECGAGCRCAARIVTA